MKFLIVLAAVAVVASAQQFRQARLSPRNTITAPLVVRRAASTGEAAANILRQDSDILPDGSYKYSFDTDNGISAQSQGQFKNFGGNPPSAAVVAQGSFTWTSPEGQPIGISYIADEYGYRASGDALPTPPSPPAIPSQIARALEYIAKNAPRQ